MAGTAQLSISEPQLEFVYTCLGNGFLLYEKQLIKTIAAPYVEPPPIFNYSNEFLNLICQRKVPGIA